MAMFVAAGSAHLAIELVLGVNGDLHTGLRNACRDGLGHLLHKLLCSRAPRPLRKDAQLSRLMRRLQPQRACQSVRSDMLSFTHSHLDRVVQCSIQSSRDEV
jgi:hypothetical protein